MKNYRYKIKKKEKRYQLFFLVITIKNWGDSPG